jgi:DNA mismatch endonuclease (patch repair protein)
MIQTDVLSPEMRSDLMSKVRSKGNLRTELALIKVFRDLRIIGWRRNQKVFGKPDFVFWKGRTTVFVDGCFWHCCPLHATWPKNNSAFWEEKLAKNRARDRLVTRTLKNRKWRVIRIWEHELKRANLAKLKTRLKRAFPDLGNCG